MNPGVLGVVVNVVFGIMVAAAGALPGWRRRDRGESGLGAHRLWTLLIGIVSVGVVTYLWMYTLVDAQTTNARGDVVLCGSSYSSMLDTRLERFEGLPHDCIVHSRIAITLLVLGALATLLVEHRVLRRLAARS
ncbi:hypothetical protein [Actinomyces viscosus]|uniref:hypothetical protein n=1 Tax=Actinomyces viscosus TaxID=1656 RepID=UPI0028E58E49|nr:hypothetical protein [Actinomyces viscosus]